MEKIAYPKVGVGDILLAMWRGIRPQKWVLILGLSAFLVDQTIRAAFVPLAYKNFFDTLSTAIDPRSAAPVLIGIVITIGLWNFARLVLRRIGDFSISAVEARTMARLRQAAFDYLMFHSHSFFSNNFTGSLVQRVSRFARGLERFIDTIAFNLIPLTVTIVAAIIVTWNTERVLAYVILVWVSVFLLCNFVFSLWRVKYNIRVAETDSKTTGTLADIMTNHTEVSLFSAHSHESGNVRRVTGEQARITKLTWNLGNVFDAVQATLIFIAEFFIFYYGVGLWAAGTITLGTLVLAQVYVLQLSNQLWDFGRIIRTLYEVFADSKEMVEIMTLPHEIKDRPGARSLSVSKGSILFKDVTFTFNDDTRNPALKRGVALGSDRSEISDIEGKNFSVADSHISFPKREELQRHVLVTGRKVLDKVTLSIPGGEKVALVGSSGAGKTTFVRLLLRFYDVQSGAVLVDGQNIREVTLESLHKNIAMVPQDPILFHRTLLENIRYGRADATDEEVKEAARLAHCDEFISNFPDGYATFVGERGVKLSGGERQRIAIARAILKNAPVLILDEATSSLDSHSELLIQDALDKLMKGKTAIVIAHRLSTIRKMDRIVVVDQGAVVEDGTHEKLLGNPESLYRKLWELQAGGFMREADETRNENIERGDEREETREDIKSKEA